MFHNFCPVVYCSAEQKYLLSLFFPLLSFIVRIFSFILCTFRWRIYRLLISIILIFSSKILRVSNVALTVSISPIFTLIKPSLSDSWLICKNLLASKANESNSRIVLEPENVEVFYYSIIIYMRMFFFAENAKTN